MNGSYPEREGRNPSLDADGLNQFAFGELARFKRDFFWERVPKFVVDTGVRSVSPTPDSAF